MPFTNYDYSSGLAALGQGIDAIIKGAQDAQSARVLAQNIDAALRNTGQGGVTAAGLAALSPTGQPTAVTTAAPAAAAKADDDDDSSTYNPKGRVPSFLAAEQAKPASGLNDLYGRVAGQYGLPSDYLPRTAQIESSGNPSARNPSGAAGLFQFMPATAAQYGLTNPLDPVASTQAAGALAADNAKVLRQALGRDPSSGELYLAHQQGAGTAARLLANPNVNVVDVIASSYGGNRARAEAAVRQNGGDPRMSAGQFANQWTGKFGGQQTAQADMPAQGASQAQGFVIPGQQPSQAAQTAFPMQGRASGVAPETRQAIMNLIQTPGTRAQGLQIAQKVLSRDASFKTVDMGGTIAFFDGNGNLIGNVPKSAGPTNPLDDDLKRVQIKKAQQDLDSNVRSITDPQERAALGVPPGYVGVVQQKSDGSLVFPGKASTEVNINQNQQGKYAETVGKGLGDKALEYVNAYEPAKAKLENLNVMAQAMQNPNVFTGTGGEAKLAFDKAAQAVGSVFGIQLADNQSIADREGFEKFARQLAGQQAKSIGGARVTNFELDQFIKSNPGLFMSQDGNRLMINIMQQLAKRELDLSQIAGESTSNGENWGQLQRSVKQYDAQNPIVDPRTGKSLTSGDVIDKEANRQYLISQQAKKGNPAAQRAVDAQQSEASRGMPRIPANMSPDDVKRRFPSGTKVVLPDGSEGVVP